MSISKWEYLAIGWKKSGLLLSFNEWVFIKVKIHLRNMQRNTGKSGAYPQTSMRIVGAFGVWGYSARPYLTNSVSKYLQHCAPVSVIVSLIRHACVFPIVYHSYKSRNACKHRRNGGLLEEVRLKIEYKWNTFWGLQNDFIWHFLFLWTMLQTILCCLLLCMASFLDKKKAFL